MGHVSLTTPFYGWFGILQLGHDIIYMCTKYADFRVSRSKDIIGGPTI